MISEPRCMGMCSAWAMTSPRALNSAVEQSWRSLMLVEYDDLMSASPISSAMASRAAADHLEGMRSRSSSAARWPVDPDAQRFDEQIGALVDGGALAGEDHGGRVHLLDDGRARQAMAGAAVARDDRSAWARSREPRRSRRRARRCAPPPDRRRRRASSGRLRRLGLPERGEPDVTICIALVLARRSRTRARARAGRRRRNAPTSPDQCAAGAATVSSKFWPT